ncbi:MAG: LacI family DNA-binding transcriptional regulator [Ilumatobacteraceae bacterium]
MSTSPPNGRRTQQPRMDDVAAAAGVSRALVSLVMRDSPQVSARARAAVLEAARRLGYRRNLAASNLAARRTMTIGLLLNDLHNPWYAEVADGIHEVAERGGYQVILATGRRSPSVESRAIDAFLASRIDGIIVAGCRMPLSHLAAVSLEVPVVSAGRTLAGATLGSVSADDAEGARLAVEHLYQLGHRRIAHIDGGRGAGSGPRRSGYVSAMRAMGLAQHVRVIGGDFTEEAGNRAGRRLLREGPMPTGFFAANDLSAVGVIDALDDAGLAVPGRASVVGYDNTAFAALNHIGLTTIDQPRNPMGRLAATMLLGALNGVGELTHVQMRPQLVVRSTTGSCDAQE